MLLLPHLCTHSDLSLGTLLHLGNFNWPHLEILFSSPVKEVRSYKKRERKKFKGKKIFFTDERKRGKKRECERKTKYDCPFPWEMCIAS